MAGILGPKAIQQLRDDHKKLSRLHAALLSPAQANKNTPNGSLVVRVEEDIAADDYEFHDATVMRLQDGKWVEADCPRVRVRKPLDAAVAAGTRHIVTLVSNLGLCIGLGGFGVSWGILHEESGRDDGLLSVTRYESAIDLPFEAFECGSCADASGSGSSSGSGSGSGSGNDCDNQFLEMQLSMQTEIETVLAIVPAGYRAGPVAMMQLPVGTTGSGSGSSSGSGSGTSWNGWIVFWGSKMRCIDEVPVKWECCPVEGLKATQFRRIWYFGDVAKPRFDQCSGGSGSGSGS